MKIERRLFLKGAVAFASAPSLFAQRVQKNYLDVTWWDPYVANITDSATYLRRKFRQDVTDRTTGLSFESISQKLSAIVASGRADGGSFPRKYTANGRRAMQPASGTCGRISITQFPTGASF